MLRDARVNLNDLLIRCAIPGSTTIVTVQVLGAAVPVVDALTVGVIESAFGERGVSMGGGPSAVVVGSTTTESPQAAMTATAAKPPKTRASLLAADRIFTSSCSWAILIAT